MPLTPLQQHAVAMLALGHATSTVARDLDICRQTLCRWKRQPEFQRALDRELGEMMAALNTQVQSTARVLVEGGLESAQQLRHMLVKPDTKDQDRRISATQLLKFAQRFWDLLGYNAALPKPRQLCSENLDAVQDAEPIPDVLPEPEPGDRHLRAESERDPVGPETHAGGEPDWCTEWRFSPIHDDGTPKHAPEAEIPGAEPHEEPESDQEKSDESNGDPVVTVPASFVVRAARPVTPNPTHQALDCTKPIHPAKQRTPLTSSLLRSLQKNPGRTMRTAKTIVTSGEPPKLQTARLLVSCNILSHFVASTMSQDRGDSGASPTFKLVASKFRLLR